ncbi:nuclease-related domain-containing protein [Bacillus chungangensis]|uniref:NERD domain-containing protein n=1 Tax=Bacillus chungangensis TaxID=587633 RepID=A0ABT9WUA1_9BACI|nr:nuclease-related domain-containing protein [Bacillus chungangensis]MDQ0176886.1 hypothetical protein [Bacillus chungangensis]
MAQLIKLQDYVSRYEADVYRYPAQYVRLKKQQWDKLYVAWQNNQESPFEWENETEEVFDQEEERRGWKEKFKSLFKRNAEIDEPFELEEEKQEKDDTLFTFTAHFITAPETEEDLKHVFLDQLYKFQLKWASSTLTSKSYIDSKYWREEKLRYLLQRFPDTFLVLYEPIFLLKKAPVEMDVILLTPTEVWCISFLEAEDNAAFIGSNDNFWTKMFIEQEKRILNPLLSVNRMANIIQQLFHVHDISMPVRKAIISRNGYIDHPSMPLDLHILDKRSYRQWFDRQRKSSSPLKRVQLQAAQIFLEYCQTTSFKRLEWEEQDASDLIDDEKEA